jgi:Spy/CpxP family protein refolding chaperone
VPSHVLEHSKALDLTSAQEEMIRALFNSMQVEARAIGSQLIAQESQLDLMFAHHKIDPEKLTGATRAIGETQGRLRAAHLKYHLTTAELLTADQSKRYAELRGYASQP